MRMRKAPVMALAAMALFVFGSAALAQEPEAVTTSETRVATSMSASDRMLAPVRIGAAGPYQFIVDTAAERSVITEELALELNLQPAGRSRALTMTSSRSIPLVRVPQVSFGGPAHDMNVFAVPGGHVGAAGVLGIDALRDQRVVLDFEAGEMRVGPAPRRQPAIGPDDIVVQGRRRFGQLVLADADALGVRVDVIVDSGLEVSVGNEALRRLLVARNQEFQRVSIVSITGEALGADWAQVNNLRIGGFELTGLPVAFANAYFFDRMRMRRTPALLLGMDALQVFRRVTVDFRNRTAVFVLPEGVERPGR